MKKIISLLCLLCVFTLSFTSCKKDDTSNPISNELEYYVKYTDNGETVELEASKTTMMSDSYKTNTNQRISSTLNTIDYKGSGSLNFIIPCDSSILNKINLNTKCFIRTYDPYAYNYEIGFNDSKIGSLGFKISKSTGTDESIYNDEVSNYYNIITSITYIDSEYSTLVEEKIAWYVLTGEFKMSVQNDISNSSRVITGSYKIPIMVRAK